MSEHPVKAKPMTLLHLRSIRNRAQDRLLFGRPADRSDLAEGGTVHGFYQGDLFGFVRWRGDEYGTQTWRVIVAQAIGAGDTGTRIPGVEPGGELLLHAFGAVRARRALKAIDALSDAHELDAIASAYWRHLHLCIDANIPPEPYDAAAFAVRSFRA
jgi:hypothetical protein